MVKNVLFLVALFLFSGCASQEQVVRQHVREETASMKAEMEDWMREAEKKQYTDLVERLEAVEARLRTLREIEVRLVALEGLVKDVQTLEESMGLSRAKGLATKEGLVQMEGRLGVLEEELGEIIATLVEVRARSEQRESDGGELSELEAEVARLTSKVKELEKLSGVAAVEASEREMANLKARVEDLRGYLDLKMSKLLEAVLDIKNFTIDKTASLEAEMRGKFQLMEKWQKEAEKGGKEPQPTTPPQQSL